MPKFVIERDIPGAGNMTADDLRAAPQTSPTVAIERDVPGAGNMTADELMAASQKSCSVLDKLGSEIQWIHSYVTDDKISCVYTAPNQDLIEQHAQESGFPANNISEVRA